jgi:dTDP-glucose pyrophosphorylase
MSIIDRNGRNAAMVVTAERRLIDLLTDGDIRRAILSGLDLGLPVTRAFAHKAPVSYMRPLALPHDSSQDAVLAAMRRHGVRYVPAVDAAGRVVDLWIKDTLVSSEVDELRAVIMAGGRGTRLRPLTESTPKPMLPLAGKPALEHTVDKLRESGIRQIVIATHYLPEKISDHFGRGEGHGVDIRYAHEDEPLGTAGVLSTLEIDKGPLLIVNGDIVSGINYRAMLDFHRDNGADMTVAIAAYQVAIPYGVIETEGHRVRGLREKPVSKYSINAGIYLISPQMLALVPRRGRLEMTDVIAHAIDCDRKVIGFPIGEYWVDIGKPEDYARAEEIMRASRDRAE